MDKHYLQNFEPPFRDHANILLFGGTGVGKSSCINLFRSIMAPTVINDAKPRPTGNKGETQTVHYKSYSLNKGIVLWDTFGWTNGANYKQGEFSSILDGTVKSGTHMDSMGVVQVADDKIEIDCVIFVVDTFVLDVKQDIKDMKLFVDVAKSKGKIVAVAVTKLDDTSKDLATEVDYDKLAAKISIDEHFGKIKDFLIKEWDDDSLRVFPVINYKAADYTKKIWTERTGYDLLVYCASSMERYTPVASSVNVYDFFKGEKVLMGKFGQ